MSPADRVREAIIATYRPAEDALIRAHHRRDRLGRVDALATRLEVDRLVAAHRRRLELELLEEATA